MPADYNVGNLELDIAALDKSATSLNNVINRLQSMLQLVRPLSKGLNTLRTDMSAISRVKFGSFERLATGLNSLSKIDTQGLYTKLNSITRILTPLQGLSASMSSSGQINTFANGLQKIVKIDVAGFDTQIKSLTASLRPFLNEITSASPALNSFSAAMQSIKNGRSINIANFDVDNIVGRNTESIAKILSLGKIVNKLYFIKNYTKQMAQDIVKMVNLGIDYTETLNLWQVAMRENIDTAEKFISKMNRAYGIAEATLMKYQATFRNMLSSLGGVSADISYGLSEQLTQMALDYASLYNTTVERAMTVFQSVLSGQVRPIRSISGYDITETTIYQLYQELGGTKTMRQLTQSEKRLLRIYAVFQQMDRSGAIGDLNKTLNNTANQLRIASEAAQELGTWIGKLVELYVAPALPYLNAFLITAKNIVQAIAKSMPSYSEFDGTIKGYEDTAEAIDEVQGKLLDFDKFRSLSSNEEDTGIGLDTAIISGFEKYKSLLSNVKNMATDLADKWTSWFIDESTGEFTTKAKGLFYAVIGGLGLSLFNSKFFKEGSAISKGLLEITKETSKSATATSKVLNLLKSPLTWILGTLVYLYSTNEDVRESVNKLFTSVFNLVGNAIEPFGNLLNKIFPLLEKVVNFISPILTKIIDACTWIIELADNLGILEGIIVTILAYKVETWVVKSFGSLTKIGSAFQELLPKMQMFFGILSSALKEKGIGTLLSSLFDTLVKGIKKATTSFINFSATTKGIMVGISILSAGIGLFISNFEKMGSTAKLLIPTIALLAATLTGLAVAHAAAAAGIAAPLKAGVTAAAIAAGITLAAGTAIAVKNYANGGMPDKGTMFVAGERGAEMVYNMPSGQSGVANIQQIQKAMYGAMVAYGKTQGNNTIDDRPIDIYIDGEKVFQATKRSAKRHGFEFSKV